MDQEGRWVRYCDCLRVITHRVLVEDVIAICKIRLSDTVVNLCHPRSISVSADQTGLYVDWDLILVEDYRARRVVIVVWHADLRPDCGSVFSYQRQVIDLIYGEVLTPFIMTCEVRQTCDCHSLFVIAGWSLDKRIETIIFWRCTNILAYRASNSILGVVNDSTGPYPQRKVVLNKPSVVRSLCFVCRHLDLRTNVNQVLAYNRLIRGAGHCKVRLGFVMDCKWWQIANHCSFFVTTGRTLLKGVAPIR